MGMINLVSHPSQVTGESKTHRLGGFFILEEIQARLEARIIVCLSLY